MARGLVERASGALSAPGAWFASEPKITMRDLIARAPTIGAKLGLFNAWEIMLRPIPAVPLVSASPSPS